MSSLEDDTPLEETSGSSHSSRDEEFEEALAQAEARSISSRPAQDGSSDGGEFEEVDVELDDEPPATRAASAAAPPSHAALESAEESVLSDSVSDATQQQQQEEASSGAHGAVDSGSQDSYSDDLQPDASTAAAANQAPEAGAPTKGQEETQRYLELLRSGRLALPKLSQPASTRDTTPKSPGARLSIEDLVSPEVAANITMRRSKVLTPGPGAYELHTTRNGKCDGNRFSFGTARQRPRHVCIPSPVVSPGPVYYPKKGYVSTLSHPVPRVSFTRTEVGTRYSLGAGFPTNCPHWNPGPGQYDLKVVYKGGSLDPNDARKHGFASGVFSSTAPSTVFKDSSQGTLGPCWYDPDPTLTKPTAPSRSLGVKGPSYFDAFADPAKQPSPGPIYSTAHATYRGSKPWGEDPRATFGRGKKEWQPEVNLSGTAFISKLHAHHSLQTIHSPGPVYYPKLPHEHVPVPALSSGPQDRFYSVCEPGRVM